MISIVVPCYNCEKTFNRCIESICNQTRKEIEIVLVDDGSSDSTYELCENMALKDSRINVIHQENKGLMNAWKRGVKEASGEYIIFCDSDDYIELDLVEVLQEKINEYNADIVLYGMKTEYEDGQVVYGDNRLEEGYYAKEDISQSVLPCFFSNGDMEQGIMLMSRWTKLFKRQLLIKNFEYLDDAISVGEDGLTTFAAVLSANSIYCIKNLYAYHYMRNSSSMIGKYDELLFEKYLKLRMEFYNIAQVYQYQYKEQIEINFFSYVLLCMKKEICRNKDAGYKEICNRLRLMRENDIFSDAAQICRINQFNLKSRVFAYLIINKRYFTTYVITKLMDFLGIGRA